MNTKKKFNSVMEAETILKNGRVRKAKRVRETKDKFWKIIGLFIVIIGYGIFGCTTIEDDISSGINVKIDYERIGDEHNKGLDYVYEQLKVIQENKDVQLRSAGGSENIHKVVADACASFVLSSDYGKDVEKEKIAEIFELSFNENSLRSASADDFFNNTVNFEILTKKQQKYVDKFQAIFSSAKANTRKVNKNDNIKPVIQQLKKLEKEIISNCTSEEAIPLLITTSVGRHSLQYWNANLHKWSALFQTDINTNIFTPIRLKNGSETPTDDEWEWFVDTLISMGESDGIGALIGAGAGALAAGLGAVPGAIAGACNASAGAGIKSLLHRWGVLPLW